MGVWKDRELLEAASTGNSLRKKKIFPCLFQKSKNGTKRGGAWMAKLKVSGRSVKRIQDSKEATTKRNTYFLKQVYFYGNNERVVCSSSKTVILKLWVKRPFHRGHILDVMHIRYVH